MCFHCQVVVCHEGDYIGLRHGIWVVSTGEESDWPKAHSKQGRLITTFSMHVQEERLEYERLLQAALTDKSADADLYEQRLSSLRGDSNDPCSPALI